MINTIYNNKWHKGGDEYFLLSLMYDLFSQSEKSGLWLDMAEMPLHACM